MNKTYHVKTQADYDTLMIELEGKEYKWDGSDEKPTEFNNWEDLESKYTATNKTANLTTHEKITAELFDTYKRKNHDYGDSFTESLNEFGLVAGLVRVGDKVNRLKTLTKNEQQVSDESLRDTILDASNYLIMMAMWLDNK